MDKEKWEPPKFYWPFGFCGGRHKLPRLNIWRHRNTCYYSDRSNYSKTCAECHKEDWDHYQELWDEYYASRL